VELSDIPWLVDQSPSSSTVTQVTVGSFRPTRLTDDSRTRSWESIAPSDPTGISQRRRPGHTLPPGARGLRDLSLHVRDVRPDVEVTGELHDLVVSQSVELLEISRRDLATLFLGRGRQIAALDLGEKTHRRVAHDASVEVVHVAVCIEVSRVDRSRAHEDDGKGNIEVMTAASREVVLQHGDRSLERRGTAAVDSPTARACRKNRDAGQERQLRQTSRHRTRVSPAAPSVTGTSTRSSPRRTVSVTRSPKSRASSILMSAEKFSTGRPSRASMTSPSRTRPAAVCSVARRPARAAGEPATTPSTTTPPSSPMRRRLISSLAWIPRVGRTYSP